MEGVLESLAWPSALTWGVVAATAAAAVIAQTHAYLRQAFHRRRLDRRLARNPYIERDELRDYELAIGGALDPPEAATVVRAALWAGTLAGVPFWLAQNHLEHWWHYAALAFWALALLVGLWRRLNDPQPELPEAEEVDPLTVQLSIAGFAAAVGVFLVLGILVINLF